MIVVGRQTAVLESRTLARHAEATGDRALAILAQLPPGAFTMEDFFAARRESGLNVVGHFDGIAQILHHLISNGLIRRLEAKPSQPSLWVRS